MAGKTAIRPVMLVAAAITLTASAGAQSCDKDKVLRQMDAAAAKFQTAQADFNWDQFQTVVQEHDVQTGTIYFDRHGDTTAMAADIRMENGQPAPKQVVYTGSELDFFQPAIHQETIFRAGNNRARRSARPASETIRSTSSGGNTRVRTPIEM